MATFQPKEVFRLAREAEQKGDNKQAATHYASLSAYLRRRGKKDESLTLIRRALILAPQLARLHLQHALCAEISGHPDEAENAMRQFTQLSIEKQNVEKYRPLVESTLDKAPRLRQIFYDGVLKLDRTAAAAFLGQARSLHEQGNDAGAMKVLVDALQTGAQREDVLVAIEGLLREADRAEALIHLGRFRDGKVSLENFLVLLGGVARTDTAASLVSSVEAPERPLRDLIDELEREIGGGPDVADPEAEIRPLLSEFRRRSEPILRGDSKARMDMALAFFEMGLAKEAQEELERVPESDVLYAEAQALFGEIALSTGSHLAALDAFQKSLRCSHRTREVEFEARYKLVHVYYRLGDLRQAFGQAAELEKLAPSYRDLRGLKNQIQEALERAQGGV